MHFIKNKAEKLMETNIDMFGNATFKFNLTIGKLERIARSHITCAITTII